MIRIREIAMPPEHNPVQLGYEAARLLKVANSKVRQVRIIRRSIDARKKPDVKIVYTIDVAVDGNENKILKFSGWVISLSGDVSAVVNVLRMKAIVCLTMTWQTC